MNIFSNIRYAFVQYPLLKFLWLSVLIIGLDQATKLWVYFTFSEYEVVPVFESFSLTLRFNPGAAFSFLSEAGGWQRWFFMVLGLIVTGFLIDWLRRLADHERWNAIALVLIIGGALGNIIDRVWLGKVIDFLLVSYQTGSGSCVLGFTLREVKEAGECLWPAFNIADSAISIGAVMLFIDLIKSFFKK